MQFPNIDPIIISFGPLAISWYSMSYVVGIMLGWYVAAKVAVRYNTNITTQNLDDFVTWIIIGVIIGGRLGYVLIYDPVKYFSNPIDILKTYQGGMSFHGGFLGVVITSLLFCRYYGKRLFDLTDILAIVTPIALFLGRIANFINAELYGRVTTSPWGVVFPYSDGLPRHPSQLYEAALEGMVLFIIMLIATYKYGLIKKPGKLSGLFLIFYAIFRIIVEYFREPDIQIGYIVNYLTMGQVLSLPMLIGGLYLCIKKEKSTS